MSLRSSHNLLQHILKRPSYPQSLRLQGVKGCYSTIYTKNGKGTMGFTYDSQPVTDFVASLVEES